MGEMGKDLSPLVSVMIVAFNQRDFIEETVRSAVDQDYANLEVVVADDGSTDGTADILERLTGDYPNRLRVITGMQNLGITGNSNRGLRACKGEFVAFQGGDDVLLPGKISRQMEWFRASRERVLCYHDVEVFDSSTNKKICYYNEMAPLISGNGASQIIRRMKLGAATSIMVRRSALPPGGFDERLPVVSDWKLWIDVLASGGEYGYVPGVYARYRRHGGNSRLTLSAQYRIDCYLTVALVDAIYPQYCGDARVAWARVCAVHALQEAFSGNRLTAWRLWRLAMRNALISPKYMLGIVFSSLPKSMQAFLVRHLSRFVPELAYARH